MANKRNPDEDSLGKINQTFWKQDWWNGSDCIYTREWVWRGKEKWRVYNHYLLLLIQC